MMLFRLISKLTILQKLVLTFSIGPHSSLHLEFINE